MKWGKTLTVSVLCSSYYSAPASILVFSNPKCGSTSLPFLYAKLEGLDPVLLCDAAKVPEVRWALGIHQAKHDFAGSWPSLPRKMQIRALSDPTTRHVMFVRDPVERCWASWVTKILIREPAFLPLCGPIGGLTTREWEARVLAPGGLIREFELFADALISGSPASQDPHFAPPQSVAARMLPLDTEFLPLSMINPVGRQMAQAVGLDAEPPRLNDSGIPFPRAALSERILSALERYYAEDRAMFGAAVEPRPSAPVESPVLSSHEADILRRDIQTAQRLSVWVDAHWGLRRQVLTLAGDLSARAYRWRIAGPARVR